MDRSAHPDGRQAIAELPVPHARHSAEPVTALSPGSDAGEPVAAGLDLAVGEVAEERISVASQWQLMWWRFRRHRLAMVATVIVVLFYLGVIFTEFLAYAPPTASEAQRSLLPPQRIHWFDEGRFLPARFRAERAADPVTLKRVYTPDPTKKIRVRSSCRIRVSLPRAVSGEPPSAGVEDARPEETLFLLGTDEQGRDQWSRLMYATGRL